jgi:two-component system, chemotaxis family, response regulator PixH
MFRKREFFLLQRIESDSLSGVTATEVSGSARPIAALVVDPNTDTRTLCAQIPRQCGYEVEEAGDGRQTLAKVFSRRPDVIIATTTLTSISGFDLCRVLRRDTVTSPIPIVVLSRDGAADSQRALSTGADSVPETVPPPLLCPHCSRPLTYLKSYLGGVSAKHPEQWDYFECPAEDGTFQYRHRTRKLRHIGQRRSSLARSYEALRKRARFVRCRSFRVRQRYWN